MKRILFIVGFISLLGQIVLLKELNAAYFGVELIYTIAIGFWLIGTAIGAAINRKNFTPDIKMVQFILLICSVLIPAEVIFIRGIRLISGEVAGAFLPIEKQLFFLFFALIPVSLLTGLAFQWSAKTFINLKNSLSSAYAIESAGGIFGGVLSTLIAMVGFSNLQAGLLCGISVLIIYEFNKTGIFKNKIFWVQCFFSILFILLITEGGKIDLITASWNNPNIIKTVDTPYSRVSVSYNGGQYSIFEDDALCYETEAVSAEEFCGMALLAVQNPQKVLLLGGGYRGFAEEVLKLPNTVLDYVEYNKKMILTLVPYLPFFKSDSAFIKRINLIYSDPRTYLSNSNKYDAILTGLPEPTSILSNRYYTEEFFRMCAQKLNTGGVLAFSLRSDENLWSPVLTKRNASIYKTLKSVFKDVVVLPGTINIFIASQHLINFNTETLIARFRERGTEGKVISPQYIKYLLQNDRYEKIKNLLNNKSAPVNRDNNPVSYQFTIAIWLSKFFPEFTGFREFTYDKPAIGIYSILLIGLLLIIRKFYSIKKYALIFIISMLGMLLEMVLLMKYQTTEGILFQNIGLLLTSFMAGLSAGAFFINHYSHKKTPSKGLHYFILCLFILLTGIVLVLFNNSIAGFVPIMLLIFIDGFLVSAVFSVLSFSSKITQVQIVSPLYVADILGGCAGSLTAGLILIPMFGLTSVLLLIGLTAIITLLLV